MKRRKEGRKQASKEARKQGRQQASKQATRKEGIKQVSKQASKEKQTLLLFLCCPPVNLTTPTIRPRILLFVLTPFVTAPPVVHREPTQ